MRRSDPVVLATSVAVTASVAAAGALATSTGAWYESLRKPGWNPPKEVFGPVWTVLYASQAVSAWLMWRADPGTSTRPMGLFGAQLLLNGAWSFVFFRFHRLGLAVIEVAVLWMAIALTITTAFRRSRIAGLLLAPYLAWVTFAAALTTQIWRLNRGS
jgi:benzodiazapine receptor